MWKPIVHIDKDIEISDSGKFRSIKTGKEILSNFSTHTGAFEVGLRNIGSKLSVRRACFILVGRYFINGGEAIPNDKKVVFKNGDYSDFNVKNLAIVNRYEHVSLASNAKKKDLYVNYGDEIYC